MDIIFSIIVLIMSVVVHELAHGYAALSLGDSTAKYQGRLTLNPLKHLDPFGSVILPLLMATLPGGFIFGWAKPVPYNPYNLRNRRWGELLVAIAGPASNIAIALLFSIIIRLEPSFLPSSFFEFSTIIVVMNVVLALFNMVPIPPLDGSKILFALIPQHLVSFRQNLERASLFLLLFFIFFLWKFFVPIIYIVINFLIG